MTPLHFALGGDEIRPRTNPEKTLEVVKILVEAKANVNAGDNHGITPVYLAIDDLKILKYLAEHGGSLAVGNAYRRQTLLHWAVNYDAPVKNIEFILNHDAKINECDGDGYTALHRAVQCKKLNVVKCLAEHGADLNHVAEKEWKTALDFAVEDHLSEIEKYLRSRGAVSGKSLRKPRRQLKRLFSAVISGDQQRALECLSLGGDVNGEDDGGLRPLHYAVCAKNLEMIKFLLEHGADINLPSRSLHSPPLHYAVTVDGCGDLRIVKYLVKYGADVNLRDKEGKTALDLATGKNLHEIAKYLKAHGAAGNRK